MESELRSLSLNGRYVLRVQPWEARMSLWVETPELFDSTAQERLLCFTNPNWSLESAAWLNESTIAMKMRKFPGTHLPIMFDVIVNCESRTATVEAVLVKALAAVEQELERLCARSAA